MTAYKTIPYHIKKLYKAVKYHLFETDRVFIYWHDFNKGLLLLLFAVGILCGHSIWYVINFQSENKIWLSEDYYHYRIFTTACQLLLTLLVLFISLRFQRYRGFRKFMGWFIPLYFGLLLIYSAQTVGLYSPAAMGGILNILLIGFVFYQPKVVYSIGLIVAVVIVVLAYFTHTGVMPYAPLFSEHLKKDNFYQNTFWLQSMAILYLPILVISALFFEVLLRQWRRREQKIENLSQIDGLTNVYNRRYISSYVENLQNKKNAHYGLVILDLDFFKKINDGYGHDVGDQVLRQVAGILKNTIRADDLVGRFGGEEFILILPKQDLAMAQEISERCRHAIEQQEIMIHQNQVLKVTASFGIAIAQDKMLMDETFRLADQALYLSKQKGRNTISHYLELNDNSNNIYEKQA